MRIQSLLGGLTKHSRNLELPFPCRHDHATTMSSQTLTSFRYILAILMLLFSMMSVLRVSGGGMYEV